MDISLLEKIVNSFSYEDHVDEEDFSLLSGRLSRAFLYASFDSNKHQKETIEELEKSLNYVNNNKVPSDFVSGLAGFGWGVNFILRNENLSLNENELLSELDIFLNDICNHSIKQKELEFFYGAAGHLVYFLERSRSSDRAITLLDQLSLNFLKSLDIDLTTLNQLAYNNKVDLSFSHGFSGILSILTKLAKNNFYPDLCYQKIDIICAFIQNIVVSQNNYLVVPDSIEKGKMYFSPLRWCHGQLGITKAISESLDILNNSTIDNLVHDLSVTLSLVKHDVSQELVTPAFCHGTFGVAHTLKHIFKNTNDDSLPEAIDYWYDCSYELLKKQLKGKYLKDNGKTLSGLLNGIEGMGMMILDHQNKLRYSGWDESLLF